MAKPTPSKSSTHLVNPTIRDYMQSLSLEKFYGGYVLTPLPEGIYNLGIGEVGGIPLEENLYRVYQRFIQMEERENIATRYSGTLGDQQANALQARWLNDLLGEERFADNLVVSMDGGQNAISAAIRTLTSPLGSPNSKKQYVLLAAPTYPYFSAIVACNAGMQAFLAYTGEEFTQGVETYCNDSVGVILVNIPHNPMGYCLTSEQVARINRVAQRYDCAIVLDVVYGSFASDRKWGRAMADFDPERTIFADSFSKRYGFPGLRLGFALSANERLVYAMRFVKTAESLVPSRVKLAFAAHLMEFYGKVPWQIAAEIEGRCERFLKAFEPPPVADVKVIQGEANPFYMALDISSISRNFPEPDTEYVRICQDIHNVRVYPGSFVYPSPVLSHATFSQAGRLNPAEHPPYLAPTFPKGSQFVFSPDFLSARIPLLRLSFGVETRVEEAAAALSNALGYLAEAGTTGSAKNL